MRGCDEPDCRTELYGAPANTVRARTGKAWAPSSLVGNAGLEGVTALRPSSRLAWKAGRVVSSYMDLVLRARQSRSFAGLSCRCPWQDDCRIRPSAVHCLGTAASTVRLASITACGWWWWTAALHPGLKATAANRRSGFQSHGSAELCPHIGPALEVTWSGPRQRSVDRLARRAIGSAIIWPGLPCDGGGRLATRSVDNRWSAGCLAGHSE